MPSCTFIVFSTDSISTSSIHEHYDDLAEVRYMLFIEISSTALNTNNLAPPIFLVFIVLWWSFQFFSAVNNDHLFPFCLSLSISFVPCHLAFWKISYPDESQVLPVAGRILKSTASCEQIQNNWILSFNLYLHRKPSKNYFKIHKFK